MTAQINEFSADGLAIQRLIGFLQAQSKQGLTQQKVAVEAGIPHQYLSDIKGRRRPMTELVARRLGARFHTSHEWFMGLSDSVEPSLVGAPRTWLPLFTHPIYGEPRAHPKWDGIGVEVGSAASAKVVPAEMPYVLKYQRIDVETKFQRGDLLLISQAESEEAEISVIEHRKKHYLARPKGNGWERLANGDILPANAPVRGHAVAIIWSSLLRKPN